MNVGSISFKGNVVSHNSAKELLNCVDASESLDKSYFAKMLSVTPEDVFSAQNITDVEDGSKLVVMDLKNGLRISAKPDFAGLRRIFMLPDGNSITNYWSHNSKSTQKFGETVSGIFNHLSEIAKSFK